MVFIGFFDAYGKYIQGPYDALTGCTDDRKIILGECEKLNFQIPWLLKQIYAHTGWI